MAAGGAEQAIQPPAFQFTSLSRRQAFGLPLVFTLGLAAFSLLGAVRQNPKLLWSVLGAAATLFAWNAVLFESARRTGRALTLVIVVRKQHYLQAGVQGSLLLYWSWYWPPLHDSAHLIAAQLVFAYAFDMLLCWSRRDTCTCGLGPFPVIFSINFFLWFKPDWFYLQFVMVAAGFAAKELIRWDKDGRSTHIFNPSSFPLALFSIGLLLTGATDITWGKDIASTLFYPPHMYLVLFLVGLPGQFFFGVTTMTMSAVVTTYVLGLLYFAATGTYFFYDSYVPIAVFLGMHLLFTDPSTAPRTDLGRVIFGVLYGLSTVLLYELLGNAGLPTFYDKLLQVPILNLSVQLIDRAARSTTFRRFDPASLGRWRAPWQRNLAYMTVWAIAFAAMSAAHGVGDSHPGQWLPYWQQACAHERPYACAHLDDLEASLCANGAGWACNEFAILQVQRQSGRLAAAAIQNGCALGFAAACANIERMASGTRTMRSAPPTLDDYSIILRGSKGPIADRRPSALYARACEQGWPETCGRDR